MTDLEKMQINLECLKLAVQVSESFFNQQGISLDARVRAVKYKAAEFLEFVESV